MADEKEEELISLAEAAKRLGFTELYVRTLVRKSKLSTVRVPLGPESQVWKHMLKASDVEALRVSKGTTNRVTSTSHNHRSDGRRKYSLYLSDEEAVVVKGFLTERKYDEALKTMQTTSQVGVYRLRKAKKIERLRSEAKR